MRWWLAAIAIALVGAGVAVWVFRGEWGGVGTWRWDFTHRARLLPLEAPRAERLETSGGPVHVYRPSGYRREQAGVVVYVHGYYTDVDQAVREHRLLEQFEASGLNALFVLPSAPSGQGEPVRWLRLEDLLAEVSVAAGLQIPRGRLVAVAHSGGYRTVAPWLTTALIDSVVLLDALYGSEERFADWAQRDPPPNGRLVLVGVHTGERMEQLVRDTLGGLLVEGLLDLNQARAVARSAPRLVYVRSPEDHMGLVTAGRTIPAMLQLVGLARVDASGAAL